MSSIIFFLFFIPLLSIILLSVNFIFAPHKPYKEKKTPFECGYHSFSQTRSQFSISFFLFAYVFLLLDIEIILIYPFPLSAVDNTIYGLFGMIIFTTIVTVGFVFELGKEALKITSKQYEEFPPDPYGFISSHKLSTFIVNIFDIYVVKSTIKDLPSPYKDFTLKPSSPVYSPFIWDEMTEQLNMQAIEELGHYLSWAIGWFQESVVEYDFIMKPVSDSSDANINSGMFFEYSNARGVIPRFTPPFDSPMWNDKLYRGRSAGEFFWLSHYKNNNMGVPYVDFEYRLIKSVYINAATGLSHQTAPVPQLTRNWTTIEDKIKFNNEGIHAVSAYYEIIRSTVQNICAHVKYGYHLIEQWKAMETEDFLEKMGYEEDDIDANWVPSKIDLLSIMKKQGWDPENERAKEILENIGNNASPKEIKDIWIHFSTNILHDQEKYTQDKCKIINDSVILSELAKEKMDQYNHRFSNWPINPPVERLVEFTAPNPPAPNPPAPTPLISMTFEQFLGNEPLPPNVTMPAFLQDNLNNTSQNVQPSATNTPQYIQPNTTNTSQYIQPNSVNTPQYILPNTTHTTNTPQYILPNIPHATGSSQFTQSNTPNPTGPSQYINPSNFPSFNPSHSTGSNLR